MTDDLISRQAVLDRKYVVEVKNMWHMTEEIEVVNVDDIKALPSVNPQEPKTDVLDKIRAEIADLDDADYDYEGYYKAVTDALKIIDKYKAESEDKA